MSNETNALSPTALSIRSLVSSIDSKEAKKKYHVEKKNAPYRQATVFTSNNRKGSVRHELQQFAWK
jgi:hypothetical protein